jgi:hypothetical protein
MLRPTGSKAHRAWKCPASIVLAPITAEGEKPSAARGTAIHRYLERVRVIGMEAALLEAAEELRPFLTAIDFDALPTHLATEVAFLWDWKARTAREIGRNIGRDYAGHLERTLQRPIGPTEIALTVDLVGIGGALGYVGDYKTGRTRYPEPERFAQTLLGALCVRALYDCPDVRVELIYIDADGDDFRARGIADSWILDDFADEFARAMELAEVYELEHKAGRPIPLRTGEHCDYCEAFKHCEAQTGLVRKLPASVDALLASGYLKRERVVDAYHEIQRYKQLLASMESEIYMLTTRPEIGPLDLGDGHILGPVEETREKLNGKIAASVLEQWHGKEARDEAVTLTMSQEALREAVSKRRKPGEKISTKARDGVLDRIQAEIRARGGIDKTITSKVAVRKAKKQLSLP